jgi:hypothetical protein
MKRLFICLGLFLFLPSFAFAQEQDPRPEMHALVREISSLEKFLFSEQKFLAPENTDAIRSSLESMKHHLSELQEHGTFKDDPVLATNLALLTRHMSDTARAFTEGNKHYARYMLQSSLQMCIACHTRKKVQYDFALPVDADAPLIDQGDFYFATRQFDKGRAAYEAAVKTYPSDKVDSYALRKALLSLAVYYARVKEDPKAGASYFASVSKQPGLPLYLQKEDGAWARDFASWGKEKHKLPEQATETQLLQAAGKLLRSDDFSLVADTDRNFHIRRLRASALLHRLLEQPGGPSPAKGQALYLLGQIYHRINHHLFFRFGEMYLKACIHGYPKTKVAKDCYQALEQAVTEGYTGSAGTSIPEDEQVELSQLKRLAY